MECMSDLSEGHKMAIFINGLKQELRHFVISKTPTKLNQAIEYAEMHENLQNNKADLQAVNKTTDNLSLLLDSQNGQINQNSRRQKESEISNFQFANNSRQLHRIQHTPIYGKQNNHLREKLKHYNSTSKYKNEEIKDSANNNNKNTFSITRPTHHEKLDQKNEILKQEIHILKEDQIRLNSEVCNMKKTMRETDSNLVKTQTQNFHLNTKVSDLQNLIQ